MLTLALAKFILLRLWWLIILTIAAAAVFFIFIKKHLKIKIAVLTCALFAAVLILIFGLRFFPSVFSYPPFVKTYGPADSPVLSLKNVLTFLSMAKKMDLVADIARDPNEIPPPVKRSYSETVGIKLTAREVFGEIAPGVKIAYWTFDGKVPGPFLRVREGDVVELTLENASSSVNYHNIDLHAVTGPGGGAVATNVAPGESKTFTFRAFNPGLYVYHCAHPNVAVHDAHGMYGLILVEPKEGLPEVDKEFYVMQGEFYPADPIGSRGLQIFDGGKLIGGLPEYVVFNGRTGALSGDNMKARVGDKIRIFAGNAGVNFISSFHVIGEIFDTVYPEASIGGAFLKNVQTTLIPAGGAAIAEFVLEVPGKYILVDHALARMDRGAWGILEVSGEKNPSVFSSKESEEDSQSHASHGH